MGSFARFDICWEICGDGRNMGKLLCDDGNNFNNDGCDAFCTVEKGFECLGGNSYLADVCTEICGDAINLGNLPCDDGNKKDGDGCSSTCKIEAGWKCSGGTFTTPDTCSEICGDGVQCLTMFCDDGNSIPNDGCTACSVDPGYYCGGGTCVAPFKPDLCWRSLPRLVNITLSLNNTVITMFFNETTFMQNSFSKDDIYLFLTGPRDVYTFSFDILNTNYYRGTNVAMSSIQLQIKYVNSGQFFGL